MSKLHVGARDLLGVGLHARLVLGLGGRIVRRRLGQPLDGHVQGRIGGGRTCVRPVGAAGRLRPRLMRQPACCSQDAARRQQSKHAKHRCTARPWYNTLVIKHSFPFRENGWSLMMSSTVEQPIQDGMCRNGKDRCVVLAIGGGVAGHCVCGPGDEPVRVHADRDGRANPHCTVCPRQCNGERQPPGRPFSGSMNSTPSCSDYDPQSELRRLCDTSSEGKAVPVSDDLWRVLVRAEELSERSEGAFDVTVGPLVHLWRNARHTKELPSAESLAAARAQGRLPLHSSRPQAARGRVAAAEDAAGPGRDRQGLRGR